MGLSVYINKQLKGFSLDVSWEIGDEFAVLFGFSGSGKSLTLQLIAGLMNPDSGVTANEKTYFDAARHINAAPQRPVARVCISGSCPVPAYDSQAKHPFWRQRSAR